MRWSAILVLAATQMMGAPVYQSEFAVGPGAFGLRWTGSGRLDGALDRERTAPSGAPTWRTTAATEATGTVGLPLRVGAERTWRIELWAAATIESGSVSVALKGLDAQGRQLDWIGLAEIPAGGAGRKVVGVAQLPSQTAQVELLVLHQKFRGRTWLGDLRITAFDATKEFERWRPTAPVRWATTGFLHRSDPQLRDTGAKLFVAAGITHTRAGIDWRQAEPERGRFDFSGLERQLADLERYGARADLVFINGTPQWAHQKTIADMLPERRAKGQPWVGRAYWAPRDWADWERFVRALLTHFKGRVPVWEILNEPDIFEEGFNGTYEDYVEYLRRAGRIAHEVDPACRVYCAAFVRDQWLGRLLADGLADSFDGICIHPYHSQPAGVLSRTRKTQLELVCAGVFKPLAITEMGYQSGGWKQGPAVKTNEQDKAAAGAAALRALADTSDFITWYTGIERGNLYGLLRDDGDRLTPQPIYWEYAGITGALTDRGPVKAEVTEPQPRTLRMVARNTSDQPQAIRFWPVGLVGALGFGEATGDWQGSLAPGEAHELTVSLRPTEKAKGSYPVGLAVVASGGNQVVLTNVAVAAR